MAHTNSTANYALPQFITTDKPAWLVDINGAFFDIDAAIKNASDAAGAAQSDATQALTDASTADTKATAADTKGAGAIASIEAQFDPTTIYAVGAKVMYNSLLYICTTAVVTPGPWTGAANWARLTVNEEIADLQTEVDNIETAIATTSGSLSIPTGVPLSISRGYVAKQGRMAMVTFCIVVTASINSGTVVLKLPAGFSSANFTDAIGWDTNGTIARFYLNGGNVYVYQNIPAGTYFLNASFITSV